jgi:hypothetical protein
MKTLLAIVAFTICWPWVPAAAAQELPQVHLNAEGLAPRPIEQLTGSSIVRYYALAWQAMGQALESDLSNGVGDAFTGFAKERLVRRVAEQGQAGLHVHIVDHGHQVKALFYSTDGTAMQLVDRAELEIQTFDGSKLISTDNSAHTYMILMTPGADRWYVRDLEEVPAAKP